MGFLGTPLSGVSEVNIMNRSLIDIQFKIDKLGPSSALLWSFQAHAKILLSDLIMSKGQSLSSLILSWFDGYI